MPLIKNKEFDWKPIVVKGLIYLIGIPLSIIASVIFGFMIVGFIWFIPNFFAGVLDWLINGTYPFIEIIEWNVVWTRTSIVLGIIIAMIMFINIFSESDIHSLRQRL